MRMRERERNCLRDGERENKVAEKGRYRERDRADVE